MKKITLLLSCLISLISYAQNDCSNGRYLDPIFEQVLVTPSIPYGSGEIIFDTLNSSGVNAYPLFLDVYQPALDTTSKPRPTIVFAFGGAFVYGARVSPDIVELCNRYAQLGYVCVSIDYRLSDELLVNPNPENATRAVLKGTHDMRAAVRFLYRSAKDLQNPFNIDTNQIYVGGVSAGAFCALHLAYLQENEVPEILRPEFDRTGGIEGTSGNPGFSSRVAGVINLCGALGEKEWLDVGDVPIVSMHGTEDETVPYDEDTVRILDINYPVAGSAAIHRRADEIGVTNSFYTWFGAGHVPFVGNAAYMDTTFDFTSIFMHERVCNEQTTGVNPIEDLTTDIAIYPIPSNDVVNIDLPNNFSSALVTSTDGRVVYYTESASLAKQIDMSFWDSGMYLIRIKLSDNQEITRKLYKK